MTGVVSKGIMGGKGIREREDVRTELGIRKKNKYYASGFEDDDKRAHKLRNVGRLYNLEKAKKWILI